MDGNQHDIKLCAASFLCYVVAVVTLFNYIVSMQTVKSIKTFFVK
jgi:hypothetical protein